MPPRHRAQALLRRHRFTSQGSFDPVLRGGRKIRGGNLVVHALASPSGRSRVGLALPRRLAPLAVERNRVKRIVREAFRRHGVKSAGVDCVVALRAKVDSISGRELARELAALLDQLQAGRR